MNVCWEKYIHTFNLLKFKRPYNGRNRKEIRD